MLLLLALGSTGVYITWCQHCSFLICFLLLSLLISSRLFFYILFSSCIFLSVYVYHTKRPMTNELFGYDRNLYRTGVVVLSYRISPDGWATIIACFFFAIARSLCSLYVVILTKIKNIFFIIIFIIQRVYMYWNKKKLTQLNTFYCIYN